MTPDLPSTITRLVSSIVVYTAKTCTLRSFTHIGEKISKNHPTFTDGNTASAVDVEPIGFWIKTSCFHRNPTAVSSGWSSFLRGVTMRKVSSCSQYRASAAAFYSSVSQCGNSDGFFNPADTFNCPVSVVFNPVRYADGCQHSESLACNIMENWHF